MTGKALRIAGIAFFVALCLFGQAAAYNWYAPNSFDEVKTTSPDYQLVYQLCRDGKAPGYTADFFSRNLSRYELAGIMESILDHEKALTDEEKEQVLTVAKRYERELEALGYKKKEKRRPPRLSITHDARVRVNDGGDADARVRIGGTWHIGKDTDIESRGNASLS